MIFGPFEKYFHGGSLWRGHISVIYFILTKQIFLHLYFHDDWFYNLYINKTINTKYLDDNSSGAKPFFFTKTGIRCSFGYSSRSKMCDRHLKITKYIF